MINLACRTVIKTYKLRSPPFAHPFSTLSDQKKSSPNFLNLKPQAQRITQFPQNKNPYKQQARQKNESSDYYRQQKMTIHLTEDSSLSKIMRHKRTTKQKILAQQCKVQWMICWVVGIVFTFAGHMFFPQSYLSTNMFFWTDHDITRDAQKQVLSGKFGTPKIPVNNLH